MLAIVPKTIAHPPPELNSLESTAPGILPSEPGQTKHPDEILRDFHSAHPGYSSCATFSGGTALACLSPLAPRPPSSLLLHHQRLFCSFDDVHCTFVGSITNLSALVRQYGLSGKSANEALLVIQAYRTLRDRGPYPADQVIKDLAGSFAFIVYDNSTRAVFAALSSDGGVPLYWGIAADGSVVICDEVEIIKGSCSKSYAPFPTGCMFHGEGGLRSFEHPMNRMKAMPWVDIEGVMCGASFKGVPVKVRRPTDYKPSLAATLGPSQPSPHLNLAAVGLSPSAIGGSEGPDRIFVGGLPYYFTDAQIRELLESFGPLRGFDLVKDRDTGNSKGYGFCVYQDPSVTDIACAALHGLKMADKTLTVRRATASMGQMKPEQELILQQAHEHIAIQKLVLQSGGVSSFPGAGLVANAAVELPTKVLCLTEMISVDELRDDKEYKEILEDMREESEKFGSLVNLIIPRPGLAGEAISGVGKVFLEYANITDSARAKVALHGRRFGTNTVCAAYYPEDKFSAGDYGTNTVCASWDTTRWKDPSVTDIACAALNGLKMADQTLTVQRATASMGQMKPEQELILQQGHEHIAIQKLVLQSGGVSSFPGAGLVANAAVELPTKVLCLTEMISVDELRDDEEYKEILEDMREESEKFGSLVNLIIPRPGLAGEAISGVGKVFLEYANITDSARAKVALHGRRFGTNTVCAAYYPEDKFSAGDYGTNTVCASWDTTRWKDPSVTYIACAALNGLKMTDKTLTVRRASASMGQMKPEQELVLQQGHEHIAIQKLVLQSGGVSSFPGAGLVANAAVELPTKVLCLTEMISVDELRDDEEYKEILEDMREESEKFGSLVNLIIPRPGLAGEAISGVGKVFLEYANVTDSARAKVALHGRRFGTNKVCAAYYPEDKFSAGDYGTNTVCASWDTTR